MASSSWYCVVRHTSYRKPNGPKLFIKTNSKYVLRKISTKRCPLPLMFAFFFQVQTYVLINFLIYLLGWFHTCHFLEKCCFTLCFSCHFLPGCRNHHDYQNESAEVLSCALRLCLTLFCQRCMGYRLSMSIYSVLC